MTVAKNTKSEREISAGTIVCRRTKDGPKFLILYHGRGYWNFPKGKIESEEKSFQTALRETQEETGLRRRDLRMAKNFKAYERFTFRRRKKPVFKTVIFYLAYTERARIRVSKEHQGYGWFLFREARDVLGKYKESQKVLKQAYDFIKRGSYGRKNVSKAGT